MFSRLSNRVLTLLNSARHQTPRDPVDHWIHCQSWAQEFSRNGESVSRGNHLESTSQVSKNFRCANHHTLPMKDLQQNCRIAYGRRGLEMRQLHPFLWNHQSLEMGVGQTPCENTLVKNGEKQKSWQMDVHPPNYGIVVFWLIPNFYWEKHFYCSCLNRDISARRPIWGLSCL